MANVFGDYHFLNGRALNLKLEILSISPSFNADDIGRIYFDTTESALKVNDGAEWITVQFSNNSSNPLIDSLGRNWLNPDLSFNPTPFNDLPNIDGLTANDTLFSVISKLANVISGTSDATFSDLSDVSVDNPQAGDIVYYTGSNYSTIDINSLANARLNTFSYELKDFDITNYVDGDILVFNGTNGKIQNKKAYFEFYNAAASTSHSVSHNLNKKHCMVQIVNIQTDFAITSNYSIQYVDENTLLVNLSDPAPVRIMVWAFPVNS